ncbi:MAG TPA: hypothetical protein VGL55_10220 [Steroidobacteraceae bacterium]|jgi:hypothetical protein
MKKIWQPIWIMGLTSLLFLGAALLTLRAAAQAAAPVMPASAPPSAPAMPASPPPPSAPEESATITDDPTIAPDAAQSADHNVSFPTDI